MDKLIESLFAYIEIVVMGALTLALVVFLLAVYHPIKRRLLDYAQGLGKSWLAGLTTLKLVEWLKLGFLIGSLYYAGVIATVASYWFLEPVRFAIQDQVFHGQESRCEGKTASDVMIADAVFKQLRSPIKHSTASEYESNRVYLKAEASVDAFGDKPIGDVLNADLKFVRLLRGTVWITFLGALISIMKLLAISCSFLWALLFHHGNESNDFYEDWIDEDCAHMKSLTLEMNLASSSEKQRTLEENLRDRSMRRKVARDNILIPHVMILAISSLTYLGALGCYRTAEFEYVALVCNGAAAVHSVSDTQSKQAETHMRH